jgi:hypothetical protein
MSRHTYSPGLRRQVEVVENVDTPGAAPRPRANRAFTQFPKVWRQQLRTVKARGTTYEVAMVILDKTRWAEWVTLPNAGLARHGINRHAKYDALRQLQEAKLIMVKERGRQSPRIKALFRV